MIYVGANYHPHDWTPERWPIDIRLMKEARFNLVRLGHLCWDSFEPSEGSYTFTWFDEVMDLFADAQIKVVLDIATRPATWLHKKYPRLSTETGIGCTRCTANMKMWVIRSYKNMSTNSPRY
jgi:beta-galactosidase